MSEGKPKDVNGFFDEVSTAFRIKDKGGKIVSAIIAAAQSGAASVSPPPLLSESRAGISTMKKTAISITAAMFAMTALSTPARANDDVIRLGIGIAGALLGEAVKGGKNRQAQPRRGDKMIGRVDGRQPAKERTAKRDKAAPAVVAGAATAGAVAFALPEGDAIPTPTVKPTEAEMTAWLADAANREQAEGEIALGEELQLRGMPEQIDTTTTAATEAEPKTEAATVELVDNDGNSWGMVTPSQQAKAMKLAGLGMSLADAYRGIGLKGPKTAQTADAEGIDLIDEQGRLWGNVPDATADKVWKAVDLGMKPSEAFAVLSGLKNPDDVAAEAKADAERKAEIAAKAKAEQDAKDAKAFADMLAGNKTEQTPKAVPTVEAKPAAKIIDAAPIAVVDNTAKTAAVEPTPEAKPAEEKAKPKLDIDL